MKENGGTFGVTVFVFPMMRVCTSLELFKTRLDEPLSNLTQWKVFLQLQEGWNQVSFNISSNPPMIL